MSHVFRKRTPLLVSGLLTVLAFNASVSLPAFGAPQPSPSAVSGTPANGGPNPRAVSLYNLGLTAFRQGSPESAIIFFKRACDIDPNLADAQYNLAVIYQSQKRFRDAIPRYEEVLRLKPSDPDAHYQCGVILFDMGRFEDARPHFNAIPPNNVHFSDSQRRLVTMNQQPGAGNQPAYGSNFAAPPVATQNQPAMQPPQQQPVQTPQAVTQQPAYNPPAQQDYQAQNQVPTEIVNPPAATPNYNQNQTYQQPYVTTGGVGSRPPQQPQPAAQPQQQQAYQPQYTPPIQVQPPVATVAPQPTSPNPVPTLPNTSVRVIATGFNAPSGLALDKGGNLYVANFMTNTVDRIAHDGSRTQFSSGVNVRGPIGLAVDDNGNLYVANYNNGTVARINPAGVSTVIATNLRKPYYLVLDKENNLYVSQQEDNSIVRISLPRQAPATASSKP